LTAFLNFIWKAMISKGLNAMLALSKFLVLLVLFFSASHANAFTSLSSVAGNHSGQSLDSLTATNELSNE
jgi:hypothetical protein